MITINGQSYPFAYPSWQWGTTPKGANSEVVESHTSDTAIEIGQDTGRPVFKSWIDGDNWLWYVPLTDHWQQVLSSSVTCHRVTV
jgi:hypothetical protein